MIKATEADKSTDVLPMENKSNLFPPSPKPLPPSRLSQKYVVVPLKLRLVVLVALLRNLVAQAQSNRGTKIIVFPTVLTFTGNFSQGQQRTMKLSLPQKILKSTAMTSLDKTPSF